MSWFSDLYRSAVGKKAVMAVTGIILFGFVVVHMIGNLKLYEPGLYKAPGETGPGVHYLNAYGVSSPARTPDFRFMRETLVTNQGIGKPYNVSARVTYNLDSGTAKTIRVDQERRKTW